MTELSERRIGRYTVRPARRADADGTRSVMLDTFYHVLGTATFRAGRRDGRHVTAMRAGPVPGTCSPAGFTRRHLLDVDIGVQTLSNYTNIAHTPLDPAWAAQKRTTGDA